MPLRDALLALLVVSIWGFNFVVIKTSMFEVPPMLQAALRFGLAAVPLVFFVRPPRTQWYWVVGFGMLFCVGLYVLLNTAIAAGMPAGLASLVLQVQALFTIGFAALVFGERPRRQQMIGAGIAFAGIGLMVAERLEAALFIPFAMTIVAAVSWGVANICAKKAGRVDMLGFIVWASLAAAPMLLLVSVLIEGPEAIAMAVGDMSWPLFGQIAFLAYPASVFGMAIWNNLLSRLPAATVTPFALFTPVAGLLSGWLVLGETISGLEAVAGGLVIAGLFITVFTRRAPAQAP